MLHCILKFLGTYGRDIQSLTGSGLLAHVPKEICAKLDPKSQKCIFIGYRLDSQFGYRLWDPESQTVIHSSDVVFNETKIHKHPEKEVEFHRVTFSDVSPPMPNIPQVNAPLDRATEHPSTSS